MSMIAKSLMAIVIAASLVASGEVLAQESKVMLKDAPGKDKAMQCVACHSLDYIAMNSRFLDKAGWTAEVNKMVNAYAAPISKEDAEVIVSYLSENYGKVQPVKR